MDNIIEFEKKLKKEFFISTFGSEEKDFIDEFKNTCNIFDSKIIDSLFVTINGFDNYVFNYGNCKSISDVKSISSLTNRMIYQMILQYLLSYFKSNDITHEIVDNCLVANGYVLSDGVKFFYNLSELDLLLSCDKKEDNNFKSGLANAYRIQANKELYSSYDENEILVNINGSRIFDEEFFSSFYSSKSREVSDLVDLRKLPEPLITTQYIKDESKTVFSNIRRIITSLMTEYCNKYNIKLNIVDGVITLDDEIIGTEDYFFCSLLELDKKLYALSEQKNR